MQDKRILLGVTGGIAAYKSPDLVRRLRERGADVQVVMTAGAREFVTPTTFQAVSGRAVRSDLWDAAAEAAMGHIELARWAHAVLIAPASADFLARLATGQADDLLATLCLATEAPIAVAPAMNHIMWANAATRANIGTLTQRGVQVFGPAEGDQACGEIGEGRMLAAVLAELPGTDVFISTAAVADYRPARAAEHKIKKTGETMELAMQRTTDVLATVATRADRPFVVGFAAETEAVEQNARTKLMKKNLDMIAANERGHDKAFDCEDNQLIVLSRNGRHELGRAGKLTLARGLVSLIAEDLAARAGARTRGTARA